jgi:hypothetical protein
MPSDAELYLRLLGERMLLEPRDHRRGPWDSEIVEAARALTAVGVIDAEPAQAIVDDYGLAIALRSGEPGMHMTRALGMRRARSQPAPRPLESLRVIACPRVIDFPWGEVGIRHVSLGPDGLSVAAVVSFPTTSHTRTARGPRFRRMAMMHAGPSGPPQVRLTDDRAASVTASFAGGGSESEWRGRFESDGPLAMDTQWIEIDGERIDLTDTPPATTVTVQQLPDEDAALRYLWQQVSTQDQFRGSRPELDTSIDALVATGRLDASEPALADVRAVAAALGHGPSPGGGNRRRLPDPWRSLLAGGRRSGPVGDVAVGAVTPEFDGIQVAISSLESNEDGFAVEFEMTPNVMPSPHEWTISRGRVTWWAADDRGNHYLGGPDGWGSSGDRCHGTIAFWPSLDPRAARLDIMPTAERSRAVISVSLPWADSIATPSGSGP